MEAIRCINKKEAAEQLAGFLSRELVHYSDKPTLLLVSGGSSLSTFNVMAGVRIRSNLSIGQVDERWTREEYHLNSRAFRKTHFYAEASKLGVPFIAMDTVGTHNPQECAERYEQYVKQWRSLFRDGVIISVLGMGVDGHIAGIVPMPEAPEKFNSFFYDTRAWFVGYETEAKGHFPNRVSTSLHFLFQEITTSFLFACGIEKRPALERLLSPDGTLAETPARIVHEMQSVFLFSDVV